MREVPDWKAKRDDEAIPPRIKARVFQRYDGICPKCTRKMEPGKWQCDHIVALVNGGKHEEGNLQPLCTSPCHSQKTKADVAQKSKDYRVRAKHNGIRKPRSIRSWRRFDGSIVHAERER